MPQLLICIDNAGYAAALEQRKIYVALNDPDALREGLVRVVDESGQDYLYPRERFVAAELPAATQQAILQAS